MNNRRKKTAFDYLKSRNRWAKRGRNSAHFVMSFSFYAFAYIFNVIWIVLKWISVLVFCGIRLGFKKVFQKREALTKKTIKADIATLDRFSRLKILMARLENKPTENNLNIGSVIDLTDGQGESDLVRIVDSAAKTALSRSGCNLITEQDLLFAISENQKRA